MNKIIVLIIISYLFYTRQGSVIMKQFLTMENKPYFNFIVTSVILFLIYSIYVREPSIKVSDDIIEGINMETWTDWAMCDPAASDYQDLSGADDGAYDRLLCEKQNPEPPNCDTIQNTGGGCMPGGSFNPCPDICSDYFLLKNADLIYSCGMGVFQLGLGIILYTAGERYLISVELTLLSLTEVILGPLLVWVVIEESPTKMGLFGGLIILFSIVVMAIIGIKSEKNIKVL